MEPVEVAIEESGVNEMQSVDNEPVPTESDVTSLYEKESIIVDEQEVEETPIEVFVKNHPLKVFYFGVTMLIIAILVFQCCFLPEYPPCSWFKCILECIEKASAGGS